MLHLTGRNDLIAICHYNAPSRACKRAFVSGVVEVLGLFNPIRPGTDDIGWVVSVTSVNDSVWYVGLVPDGAGFRVFRLNEVSWDCWQGVSDDIPGLSLTSGDHPKTYRRLFDAATATRRTG